jgi:hypothetical protein
MTRKFTEGVVTETPVVYTTLIVNVPAPVTVTLARTPTAVGVRSMIDVALTRVHVTNAVTGTVALAIVAIFTVPHAEELAATVVPVPADASSRPADFVRILAEAPLWI